MQEWIRQIIIYVILVTVLRGLDHETAVRAVFSLFSGIVLILLVVSPVLRRFTSRSRLGHDHGGAIFISNGCK